MITEKTIIVLSGKTSAVIKITKSGGITALELTASLSCSECKVLIRDGGTSEVYSLVLCGGKGKVVIDEINPQKADFCLFEENTPVAVGNCKKFKPSLDDFSHCFSKLNQDEKPQTVAQPPQIEIEPIEEVEPLATENAIEHAESEYNDEQIAVENYYEMEVAQVKESEKSIRDYEKPSEEITVKKSEQTEKIVGRKQTYYEKVSDEIEKFFAQGKRVETLEKSLPFTKWVKVENGEMAGCVVGLIGEKPDYICYGLPGKYEPIAPAELEKFCQWLPLDVKNPQGDGYWLVYQNAITGKTVLFDGGND